MEQHYAAGISVNAPAQQVFDQICNVPAWWAANVRGSASRLHSTFTVTLRDTYVDFKVEEFNPCERIVWRVTDCHLHWLGNKKEWQGTALVWDIRRQQDTTAISMTHQGLTPALACYNDCKAGWDFYIHESLLQLIATREGHPDGRRCT
ncbi:hypothetical protein EGT74_13460 [Chitinophaga lutea]|uniref:SRPBCC domain-containing protein n=1 Tax=Chitinophaga lutea TaxID=2488634 RepID=A0A3N4PH93_9BACT|nr:hypothetical protein [Chitinophaga lutea]RPE08073.1 hypothetical protein EGT74_13460 [Chitinophaga lutea]